MSKDYNRQANGRFGVGNDGGPGRKSNEEYRAYQDAVNRAVTPDDVYDIMMALKTFAKAANVPAARVVLERTPLGMPTQKIDFSIEEPTRYELVMPHGDNDEIESVVGGELPALPDGKNSDLS